MRIGSVGHMMTTELATHKYVMAPLVQEIVRDVLNVGLILVDVAVSLELVISALIIRIVVVIVW